jgi:DNA-binding NarL/FixJ family response regulator
VHLQIQAGYAGFAFTAGAPAGAVGATAKACANSGRCCTSSTPKKTHAAGGRLSTSPRNNQKRTCVFEYSEVQKILFLKRVHTSRGRVVQFGPRESQIAVLLVEGLTTKEISSRLGISENTTKGHLARMYIALPELGGARRTSLAVWILRHPEAIAGQVKRALRAAGD